jgi:CDP-diacylglycerol---glycerol-3-phosphate 3-phosphatidyltransferase
MTGSDMAGSDTTGRDVTRDMGRDANGRDPGRRPEPEPYSMEAAAERMRRLGINPRTGKPWVEEVPTESVPMAETAPPAPVDTTAPLLNVANLLTVFRLLLVPVFLALLFAHGGHDTSWRLVAALAFVVASYTDRLDGQLARRHNLVTPFGQFADPVADKALTGSALAALSALGDLPWAVTLVVVAREVGVTLLRLFVIRHGVIPASRGGKVKTVLQTVALGLYIPPLAGLLGTLRYWVLVAAVGVTILTGLDYVGRAFRLRRRHP